MCTDEIKDNNVKEVFVERRGLLTFKPKVKKYLNISEAGNLQRCLKITTKNLNKCSAFFDAEDVGQIIKPELIFLGRKFQKMRHPSGFKALEIFGSL